ncbi:uncharacterized protein LOC124622911 [Schistocerca americana]|uniref:uncharacterized protein LOC124622911 n=1 Tax=Schistocerca americana TaxID=7009 RepID=UPI001F4F39FA|nr:uncharacterized protein LOC124622911 [Schistocerca americana]
MVHHICTPAANRVKKRAILALIRERIRYTRQELYKNAKELLHIHLQLASTLQDHLWERVDGVTWAQADWTHLKPTDKQIDKFARLPGKQEDETEPMKRTVINLTGKPFDDEATSILEKGFNFAPTPALFPSNDIIPAVEHAVRHLTEYKAQGVRRETCRIFSKAKPTTSNISREERKALRPLREEKERMFARKLTRA